MATTIEELAVRFSAQTEDLTRELKRLEATAARAGKKTAKKLGGIQISLNKIGQAAKSAAGLLAGAFAIRELGRLGIHFKNAARDAEEMESKFDAVFRSSSNDVRDWANTLGKEVKRSRFSLMEFASTFQDTFVPLGFARGQAAELSKSLVELAVDVSSFNNQMETDVIRDFQSALVGNHETVRKYGIIVTEATLTQEILNSGLAKTKGEITELNKVQGRMNIIMKGTTDAQGDAARTAGSQANKEKELDAALEELSITMGQLLAPATAVVTANFIGMAEAANKLAQALRPLSAEEKEVEKLLVRFAALSKTKANLEAGGLKAISEAGIFKGRQNAVLRETNDQLEKLSNRLDVIIRKRTGEVTEKAAKAELNKIKDETEATKAAEETRHASFAKRLRKNIEVQIEADDFMLKNNEKRDAQELAAQKVMADKANKILEENMREAQRHADDFANAFQNAFDDLLFSGAKLGDMLRSLLKDLARMAIHKAILGPLSSKIGGAISGAFGFADGGVMTGGGPAPLRNYASGGIASSPQLAMFGEGTRPEAFVPLPDGRNIPVKMSGGGGNVVKVEQNLVFEAPVRDTVAAVVESVLPIVERQTQLIISNTLRGVRTS